MIVDIDIHARGPIFDGRASRAAEAFVDDAEEAIAKHGRDDVLAQLGHVLRHPTGNYASGIVTDLRRDNPIVTDGGIVYGPWLEGVGSRNRTTRFKGYATFRRVAQRLQSKAEPIAESRLPRFLQRMQ